MDLLYAFFTHFLEPLSFLVYLVAFSIQYRYESTKSRRVLVAYACISLVILTLAVYIHVVQGRNNNLLYSLFLLSSIILLFLYLSLILSSRISSALIRLLLEVNLLSFVVYAFIGNLNLFNSLGYSILFSSIIILLFHYFRQLFKSVGETNILKSFDFWTIASFVLLFFGGFFIMLTYYSITNKVLPSLAFEDTRHLAVLWQAYNTFLFISSLIVLIGTLWIISPRKQP